MTGSSVPRAKQKLKPRRLVYDSGCKPIFGTNGAGQVMWSECEEAALQRELQNGVTAFGGGKKSNCSVTTDWKDLSEPDGSDGRTTYDGSLSTSTGRTGRQKLV